MDTPFDARLAVVLIVGTDGRVLLQERDEFAPRAANQWGMVGGHIEDGEDPEVAVYRELEEETGLVLEPGSLELWRHDEFTYSDGHRGDYYVYAGSGWQIEDQDIVVGEGRQIVFVSPGEILKLDLAESARHFVPKFIASPLWEGLSFHDL